jgi:uncharacterized damage-inducible protein DinB
VTDEREALLAYLAQQRYLVRLAAYGLDDDQARTSASPSALSLGGVIKHLAAVERFWMKVLCGALAMPEPSSKDEYEDSFRLRPQDSLSSLLGDYAAAAGETEQIVMSIADLGQRVPVPHFVPWFPRDVEFWSARWVLLHLIEETARHAGHSDIVREALDGATAFALMAAAENWPATPWITPWAPLALV